MILPGMTPIAWVDGPCPRATKSAASTRRALTLSRPTGSSERARGEQSVVHHAPARQRHRDGAMFEVVDHDEIGAPAGRDQPAVPEAEDARPRNGRGAIGGERRRAKLDRRADDEVEMALLRDVERIAVVGAEGDERRVSLGDDGREGVQILAHRAFADQQLHALGELLSRLGKVGDLVVGAHAGAQIAIEGGAGEERAMSVDRPGLERRELGEA